MSTPPVFERLQAYHDRKGFDCGSPVLNHFLQQQARQNADRNIGVTHVAVTKPDRGLLHALDARRQHRNRAGQETAAG